MVCTQKMECFEGLKLLLVQPVDENGKDAGAALVAFDVARAGEGDLVIFEAGKEAAQANPNGWFNPADAAIIGIVDAVTGAGNAPASGAAEAAHDAGDGGGQRGLHREAPALQGAEDPGGAARRRRRASPRARALVAVDGVQAGIGDRVLVVDEGGSARSVIGDESAVTVRTAICAIVDRVDIEDGGRRGTE